MDSLMPLMVILPIASALFLNLLHDKDRTIKILAIVTAIVLPIIPLLTGYGSHYFGGYAPLSQNLAIAQGLPAIITNTQLFVFHPGIVYVFGSAQKIMIFIFRIVGILRSFHSFK